MANNPRPSAVPLPSLHQSLEYQGITQLPNQPAMEAYRSRRGMSVIYDPRDEYLSASYANRALTDAELVAVIQAFFPQNAPWTESPSSSAAPYVRSVRRIASLGAK